MIKYELYHDESLENGYWHGILLVPIANKERIVEYLQQARENTHYHAKLGIKKVKRRKTIFACASAWIQIGVGFLRTTSKGIPYPIDLAKLVKGKKDYKYLPSDCVGAKFILFRERDNHQDMRYYPDHASKIETSFRIGLKGGLHFLGNAENGIHIEKMHFDGHEHHDRHLDKSRIVGRLKGLRTYCSVSNRADVIDDKSSNHRKKDGRSYEDCQLLQLTDLLVGSFRTALGEKTREIHIELALPVSKIISRYQKGYARMRFSRWFNSVCMSQSYLENGKWQFETIEYLGQESRQGRLSL